MAAVSECNEPSSFHVGFTPAWCRFVLEHDLPQLPKLLGLYEAVPVARMAGPHFAAVLSIGCDLDDFLGSTDVWSDVRVFARRATGWEEAALRGGGSWATVPFQRPRSMERRAAWIFGWHRAGGEGWRCNAAYGVAGLDGRFVEIIDRHGTAQTPIDSPFGAFIACGDGDDQTVVRVVDEAGAVLVEERYRGVAD